MHIILNIWILFRNYLISSSFILWFLNVTHTILLFSHAVKMHIIFCDTILFHYTIIKCLTIWRDPCISCASKIILLYFQGCYYCMPFIYPIFFSREMVQKWRHYWLFFVSLRLETNSHGETSNHLITHPSTNSLEWLSLHPTFTTPCNLRIKVFLTFQLKPWKEY